MCPRPLRNRPRKQWPHRGSWFTVWHCSRLSIASAGVAPRGAQSDSQGTPWVLCPQLHSTGTCELLRQALPKQSLCFWSHRKLPHRSLTQHFQKGLSQFTLQKWERQWFLGRRRGWGRSQPGKALGHHMPCLSYLWKVRKTSSHFLNPSWARQSWNLGPSHVDLHEAQKSSDDIWCHCWASSNNVVSWHGPPGRVLVMQHFSRPLLESLTWLGGSNSGLFLVLWL